MKNEAFALLLIYTFHKDALKGWGWLLESRAKFVCRRSPRLIHVYRGFFGFGRTPQNHSRFSATVPSSRKIALPVVVAASVYYGARRPESQRLYSSPVVYLLLSNHRCASNPRLPHQQAWSVRRASGVAARPTAISRESDNYSAAGRLPGIYGQRCLEWKL